MTQVKNKFAKGLAVFLAALMVFVMLPGGLLKASAASVTAYYNGSGLYTGSTNTTTVTDKSSITQIVFESGVTSIENGAFVGCTGLTSVTIPDSVTAIGSYAFASCTGLTSVTIPNSVTSIGEGAFVGCTGLTSVTIPDSVTAIGSDAFASCTALTNISISNSVTSIGKGAFDSCAGLTSITIPNSVTSIGGYAFRDCYGLADITIPNSVTSIGDGAFVGCTGLTSITIPNSITSIGDGAFYGCTGLTSITIPNGITSIGVGAFYGCTGLTSITIPNSVTFIGDIAFQNCTELASVYFDGDPSTITISSNAFFSDSKLSSGSVYCTSNVILYINGTQCVITPLSPADLHSVVVSTTPSGAGGTVTPSTANGIAGETISLAVTPESGYYLKSLSYNDGSSHAISGTSFTMPASNVTVSAVFAKTTCTATFDKNGGGTAASPASATAANGGTVTLPAVNPTRLGYTFAEWNTKADGSGTAFTASTPVTDDITVYAQWMANNYEIVYNLNGGENSNSNPSFYSYGKTIALSAPTRAGYTFAGWYSEPSFQQKITSIGGSQTGTVTLYADWIPNIISEVTAGISFDITNATFPSGVTSATANVSLEQSSGDAFKSVKSIFTGKPSLGSADNLVLYNLELLDQDGNPISFTGKVTVRIPIPSGMSGDLHIYWYNDADGMVTDMNAKQENGYLVFEATHFSYYAVAELSAKSSSDSGTSSLNDTSSSASSSDAIPNPGTGNDSSPFLPAALFGVFGCGLIVVTRGRRFRKKN